MIPTLPRRALLAASTLAVAAFGAWSARRAIAIGSAVDITLDPSRRFQAFRAWEATIELLEGEAWPPSHLEVFERLGSEVGINRLRLEVYSGAENTNRSFERLEAGEIDYDGWRPLRYATVNDDADPYHINPAGFDFADLDWRIDNFLLPLQEIAAKSGRRYEVNFTYVAFAQQIRNGAYIHTNPEEYGEFILAAFLHMKEKYGLIPEYFEPILEPDNIPNWTPALMGPAVAAATKRLTHAGFRPKIIVPAVTNIKNALPFFDAIAATPGATELLSEIAYHRYWGGWPTILEALSRRAKEMGLQTAMLEFWDGRATYDTLHDDLLYGQISAWQGRTVLSYHRIDATKPPGQQVSLADDTRMNMPYFRAIRPGYQRIGAASSLADAVAPLAFQTPEGGMTVVVKSIGAAPLVIHGLPAGSYRVDWATPRGSGGAGAPVATAADGTLAIEIPDAGTLSVVPA